MVICRREIRKLVMNSEYRLPSSPRRIPFHNASDAVDITRVARDSLGDLLEVLRMDDSEDLDAVFGWSGGQP